MKNKEIEDKFIELSKVVSEIKENYSVDFENIAELCEEYDLESDDIEHLGFDLVINRMVIKKLENRINELYDMIPNDIGETSDKILITKDDVICEEAKKGNPQLMGTVGNLKNLLNNFSDDLFLTGKTTDGRGNWFTYPVFGFKVQGYNNNSFCIYLNEHKNVVDDIKE